MKTPTKSEKKTVVQVTTRAKFKIYAALAASQGKTLKLGENVLEKHIVHVRLDKNAEWF